MIFGCPSCGADCPIPDDKIKNRILKVRCKHCSHVFYVKDPALDDSLPNDKGPQAPADDEVWFYALNQQTHGPVSVASMRHLMETSQILSSTLVWREGMAEWRPLGTMAELTHILQQIASPSPDEHAPVAPGLDEAGVDDEIEFSLDDDEISDGEMAVDLDQERNEDAIIAELLEEEKRFQKEFEAKKDEARRKKAEREAQAAHEQELARQLAAEEKAKAKAEAEAKAKAEEDARKQKEAEAKAKAEADARKRKEAEAKAKAEEDARKQKEAEAKAKAEEDARKQKEAEAKAKAEEDARKQKEAEAKAKAEADARKQKEAEAKAKAEADARKRKEAEAKAKAEADARKQKEAEAKAKAEEDARKQKEAEAKAKAEADARKQKEAEAKAKAEADARKRKEAEAKAKAEKEEKDRRRRETIEARAEKEVVEAAPSRTTQELLAITQKTRRSRNIGKLAITVVILIGVTVGLVLAFSGKTKQERTVEADLAKDDTANIFVKDQNLPEVEAGEPVVEDAVAGEAHQAEAKNDGDTDREESPEAQKMRQALLHGSPKKKTADSGKRPTASKPAAAPRVGSQHREAPPMMDDGMGDEPLLPNGLTQSQIKTVVNRHMTRIQYCYDTQLRRDPNIRGKLVVEFTVGNDGRVDRVRIKSDRFKGTYMDTCVSKAIRKWRFPRFGGDPISVEYPFVFHSSF